jgi:shikimate dehydrogenase
MDRYAVIGNPVAHSLSPRIHAHFAVQTGQTLQYIRLLAPLDGFVEVAGRFFTEGGRGANVTVPFKGEAAAWVDLLDPLAAAAGAVNTIKAEGARRVGFNTDGIGLVRDLEFNLGWNLRDRRVLLLGAGGASRGVVGPLLAAGVAELVVANRTPERAEELVVRFPAADQQGALRAAAFERLAGQFDVIVNATSAGLAGEIPALDPGRVEGAFCYDMVYGHRTAFCDWALQYGAVAVADGIGMLVEQAAEAFRIWRDVRPETQELLAQLRAERSPAV